jgi:hypothetical protein
VSFSKDGRVFATQKVMIIQGQRNRLISASTSESGGASVASTPAKRVSKPAAAPPPKKAAAPVAVAQADDSNEPSEPAPETATATKKVTPHLAAPAPKPSEPDVDLAAEDHSGSKTPAMTYVLGATGLAALGAGAALIYWGRKDNSRLPECSTDSTNCAQGTVDHIHNLYLAGNVALGVGVASLAAAYWVASRSGKEESTKEAYHFDLQPNKGGAVAGVAGTF